ncbi:MAG: ATP-binding protein [Candidatus Thorarchaeota archaeon]
MKIGTCTYCEKNTSVIHRKYSGEFLCSHCFIKSIERNISKTISKYKMLKPKDKIVVGVSGGKDSIALLYNLFKIQEKHFHHEPLIALSIDEGIKGYRNESLKNAQSFCNALGIDHKIISFKEKIGKSLDEIIEMKKKSLEYQYACNYCATIRRRLLNDGAKELGADILALGHNLTDIVETFLMNILFNRFQIIANQYLFKSENENINRFFIKKVTPLMRIPEEEIFLYSNIKKFDYYPSHCPFREKDPILRKRVLDFIQESKKFSPELEFNLLNGFLELSERLYDQNKNNLYNNCEVCGYPCGNTKMCLYCTYIKDFNKSDYVSKN